MSIHTPTPADYGTMRATVRDLNESFDELACRRRGCHGTLSAQAGLLVCEECASRSS